MSQASAMHHALPEHAAAQPERPGWIPEHITENWDRDPYAYQTEEELMPAGGLHGRILTYVAEVLRVHLANHGKMLLVDAFMLYRDPNGIKQRVGPDLLLMEACDPPPAAYDLDRRPVPSCTIEITSPDSHLKDLQSNVPLYLGLGVDSYLVIDAVTPQARLRAQIELHLWRRTGGAGWRKVAPDSSGYLHVPELYIKLTAAGQRLVFVDAISGRLVRDSGELTEALEELERRVKRESQRAELAEAQAKNAFTAGGREQTLQIARNMIAEGLDLPIISRLTGLALATLEAIKDQDE